MTDNDETERHAEEETPVDVLSTHDIVGAALGALSVDEMATVRAVAASDEHVAAELAACEATAAELAWVVPLHSMNRGRSAGIRSRLLSRAAGSRDGRGGTPIRAVEGAALEGRLLETRTRLDRGPLGAMKSQSKQIGVAPPLPHSSAPLRPMTSSLTGSLTGSLTSTRRRHFNWLALAAGIGLVAVGVELAHVVEERNHLRAAANGHDGSLVHQMATLQASVAAKDSLIVALTGPDMKVINLVGYASHDPVARMFWNRKTQEWTMYAYNVRPPKPGKTFQVWLITNKSLKPISAGMFTPDANGAAVMHTTYPMERQALSRVAVSEEPAGGMPTPTGPIVIAGVAQ